jgi:hypothetical protein
MGGCISCEFSSEKKTRWVGKGLENPRRMKRDDDEFCGFIPGTVSGVRGFFNLALLISRVFRWRF